MDGGRMRYLHSDLARNASVLSAHPVCPPSRLYKVLLLTLLFIGSLGDQSSQNVPHRPSPWATGKWRLDSSSVPSNPENLVIGTYILRTWSPGKPLKYLTCLLQSNLERARRCPSRHPSLTLTFTLNLTLTLLTLLTPLQTPASILHTSRAQGPKWLYIGPKCLGPKWQHSHRPRAIVAMATLSSRLLLARHDCC